jgi:hypothetical protein
MALPKYISRGDEFVIRSPLWWRDLLLGIIFGIALVWVLIDTNQWEVFKRHLLSEVAFVSVALGLALLSPRRLLTVFIGFGLLLFRFLFIFFFFQNVWSALVGIVWAAVLIVLGRAVGRRYKTLNWEIPDGTTALELLILVLAISAGIGTLFLVRKVLGLS